MKPHKTITGARVIHYDYLGEEVSYNLDKKTWSCTCLGNSMFHVKCHHIKDCERCLYER